MLDNFHFLRPGWLVLVPLAIGLLIWWLGARSRGGSWQRIVEPRLQAHVLVRGTAAADLRWPVAAALGAIIFTAIALAGPSIERLPVPAYRSDSALVVALDLSRSMDATDISPSRLARAKIKLLSMLERRAEGETALVVFSSHAFTVTPLTTDTSTIAALVTSVSTDIMPSQGSYVAAGLVKAAELLRQAGHGDGDILLFSDADVDDDARVAARDLRAEGYRTSVLAIGTAEGAPIPSADGGFVTDRTGDVVVPGTDLAGLQSLARTGGGRFAQLAPDDSDLDRLLPDQLLGSAVAQEGDDEEDYSADVWRDDGVWFVLALLPLLALSFRRGWVCMLAIACLGYGPPSHAFEWADLWQRPDQRGRNALEAGDAESAADLFDDPQWRGAAQYRAAEYADSAATLSSVDDIEATYNRANALARSGQLEEAISAYDRVIEAEPAHEDAIYNRELVQELLDELEQQQQQQQNQDQQSGQNQQSADNSGDNEAEDGSQSDQQASQSGQSEQNGEPQDGDDEQPSEQAAQNEQQGSDEAEQEEREGDAEQLSAALPEDIEEWASEQAADQWLRRVPQDPGGLLRRKFYYQYQRLGLDQDGRYVWPGNESEPW
jgi:Ca-activated chloride channel family protein